MKGNIKVLLYSVAIGLGLSTHLWWSMDRYVGEGFGRLGMGLAYLFVGAILIPIIFWIVGLAVYPEKRFRRAFSWLGISFGIIPALILGTSIVHSKLKFNIESDSVITDKSINSFEKCRARGYPITKTLPSKCVAPGNIIFVQYDFCIQVITPARNPETGETRDFPTPCDVPEGWTPL